MPAPRRCTSSFRRAAQVSATTSSPTSTALPNDSGRKATAVSSSRYPARVSTKVSPRRARSTICARRCGRPRSTSDGSRRPITRERRPVGPALRLSYLRPIAVPPECGLWHRDVGFEPERTPILSSVAPRSATSPAWWRTRATCSAHRTRTRARASGARLCGANMHRLRVLRIPPPTPPRPRRRRRPVRRVGVPVYFSGECAAGSMTRQFSSSSRGLPSLRNACQSASFATSARAAVRVLRSG